MRVFSSPRPPLPIPLPVVRPPLLLLAFRPTQPLPGLWPPLPLTPQAEPPSAVDWLVVGLRSTVGLASFSVGAFANIGSTAEDLAFQVLDITCSLSVLMCV